MKIFLDDIRECKNPDFIICRTADEAIKLIKSGDVSFISFDHDLGDEKALTGYDVACYIERLVYYNRIKCPKWGIHSANPVGRKRIELAMDSARLLSDSIHID